MNRVHPERGLVHDDAYCWERSHAWRRQYERETGRIWCERDGNDRELRPHGLPHREAIEAREEARHYAALEAAAMTLDAGEKELLSRHHKEEREAFLEARHQQFREVRQAAYREVREAYRERWADHFRETGAKRREVGHEQRSLAARVLDLARTGQFTAAWRALSDRNPIGKPTEKEIARERRALREAQRGETRARQDAACKEVYEERRLTFAAIKQRQKEERAELKELQGDRAQQRPYDKDMLIQLLDERPLQPDRALREQHLQERLAFIRQAAQATRELRSAIRDEVKAEFAAQRNAHDRHREELRQQARTYDREARRARRHYRRHGPLHGVEAIHPINTRQRAYHQHMRQELREERRALSAGMRERMAAFLPPALACLKEDREAAYAELLARQQRERTGQGRDRADGISLHDRMTLDPNGVLTLAHIKAYKEHALAAVRRDQHMAQARAEVTGQRAAAPADHHREGTRKTRDREKTAAEKFTEHFAQPSDRLHREEQARQQKGRERGR